MAKLIYSMLTSLDGYTDDEFQMIVCPERRFRKV